ncbi:MAG: hypothetical protein HOP29_04135 [Phycisphaerales bacterium]|nr:hypothetical protein [Phycisphaerales bacterium]
MNGTRRAVLGVVAGAWCAAASGCIGVWATENRFGANSDVVAVDGQVYIVDKSTGRIGLVDVSQAEPWKPHDPKHHDDEHDDE